MQFTDRLMLDGSLRRDENGYAVAHARVARANNVQVYLGSEVGVADKAMVRVFRPESAVFDRKSFESYARKPITVGHPPKGVNADNWRDHAVGEIDADGLVRDGEFVRVPLVFRDTSAIKTVEAGTVELSMGYDAGLVLQDGVSPSGEPYDAVMTDLTMNHVAVVPNARGGKELRIGDGAADGGKDRITWGASPIITDADMKGSPMADALRTVMVDGFSVSVTDQGAQAIEKLTKDRDTAKAALADANTSHAEAIKAKDEEIGTLKAEVKKLTDAAPKPEDLDKMVADRAALVTTVKAIDAKIDPAGKSDADLRKAAVAAKLGDEMVKDASADMIAGMFRAIAKDADTTRTDPVHDALRTQDRTPVNDAWSDAAFKSAGVKMKKEG